MTTTIILLQIIVLALTSSTLAVVIWGFFKIRKIHLATFQLSNDTRIIRRESTVLFAQLQALRSLEDKLALEQALPPVRGWAGSPDFLLTLFESILEKAPSTVVECSSGVSTLVIARGLQQNERGHVYSLEHDRKYAEKTSAMLKKYGLEQWATIIYAPLISNGEGVPWYDDSKIPSDIDPIDLLVVDGPPNDLAPLARLPAVPRLLPRMADTCVIILDDAARDAERTTVEHWLEMMPQYFSTYLHHEKGCVILERSG